VAIIPARLQSPRFPDKLLAHIQDKPMLHHTIESVLQAKSVTKVIVATPDEAILASVAEHGLADGVRTDRKNRNGTETCVDALQSLSPEDLHHFSVSNLVLDIHGDEPFLQADHIDRLVDRMINIETEGVPCGVLAAPITREPELRDPEVVKLVTDRSNRVMYFSRSAIPHFRSKREKGEIDVDGLASGEVYKRHLGVVAYRIDFLLHTYPQLETTPLEEKEQLEHLRILEHGYSCVTEFVDAAYPAVNSPEDMHRLELIALHRSTTQSSKD
jgi:3-deoxy-manno-octulosonate cytidylyltransferase (CMP-KDO synthetase)